MTEENATIAQNEINEVSEKNYHNSTVATYKLKYYDDFMETELAKTIGEDPLILDMPILKKDQGKNLNDDIGSFFKENNAIENKGCGDGISVNDVFKAQGYAAMYMYIDKHVDEVLGNQ